jgi:hypothetical protein
MSNEQHLPAAEKPKPEYHQPKQKKASLEDRCINSALADIAERYTRSVRAHSHYEMLGVIRNMRRLLAKGITFEMLDVAVRIYAADPFVQRSDPRRRKHIRSFFTEITIRQWQTPLPERPKSTNPNRDPALDVLDRLDAFHEQQMREQLQQKGGRQ